MDPSGFVLTRSSLRLCEQRIKACLQLHFMTAPTWLQFLTCVNNVTRDACSFNSWLRPTCLRFLTSNLTAPRLLLLPTNICILSTCIYIAFPECESCALISILTTYIYTYAISCVTVSLHIQILLRCIACPAYIYPYVCVVYNDDLLMNSVMTAALLHR